MALYDRVRALTYTTGTGPLTMAAAVSGYRPFSVVADGATVPYVIEDGVNWEIGNGAWSAATNNLARSVLNSSNGGNALTLTGRAQVFISPGKDYFDALQPQDAMKRDFSNATSPNSVAHGGTGAADAPQARSNLGAIGADLVGVTNTTFFNKGDAAGLITPDKLADAIAQVAMVGAYYPDYATGNSATTTGEYFLVVGTGDVFATLYLHGSMTPVSQLPSTQALADLTEQAIRQKIDDVAPPVPPTPYASWYPLDGNAANALIANRANPGVTPKNVLRFAKGTNFNQFISGSGATVSNPDATSGPLGPEGAKTAFRSVSTNSNGLTQLTNARLLPGTYTLSFEAKSHDGTSSYNTTMGVSGTTGAITVTGTYQTFSKTFTLAVATTVQFFLLWRNTTGDAYDIDFDNVRVNVGAADLGVDAGVKSLLFGNAVAQTGNPTFTNFQTNQYAVSPLGENKSLAECSVVAVLNQVGSLDAGTIRPLICADKYLDFALGVRGDVLTSSWGAHTIAGEYARTKDQGFLVAQMRVKSGVQELFLNGLMVDRQTYTTAAVTTRNFFQAYLSQGGLGSANMFGAGSAMGPIAVYDRFLSMDELYKASASLLGSLRASGYPNADPNYMYLACGDSITFDNVQVGVGGTGSYARRMFTNAPTMLGAMSATPGAGLGPVRDAINTRLESIKEAVRLGSVPIVSLLTGTNDTTLAADPAGYYQQIKDIASAVRRMGGKFLLVTILPRLDSTYHDFNVARQQINAWANASIYDFDAVANIDATAMGANSAPADTSLYYDSVHPSGAGYDIITPVVQAAFDSIVASL